ncbi:hypothetical protein [Serratia sp. AKBS12]|uniref:hypothetical protein n=1 Tax=Serratia sp. AKBS12 TaxID=2974597 RepID=UPI0021662967|nr:hypothetical protein [Serratia sp. AKBS12]MCS3407629.1 hypothetical protein [Serratia sp. AKBS12]
MIDDERMSYKDIRTDFLDCFYSCCRNILDTSNKSGEKPSYDGIEIGYASYQYEHVPFIPIENLMLNVFKLVLMAGRGPEGVEINIRNNISDILKDRSLEELLLDASEEEKNDLLYDMELLGLLEQCK